MKYVEKVTHTCTRTYIKHEALSSPACVERKMQHKEGEKKISAIGRRRKGSLHPPLWLLFAESP